MSIAIYIAPVSSSEELLKQLLHDEYKMEENNIELVYNYRFKAIFEALLDDSYLLAETNYVDRVYRDSYYNYFSSKLRRQFRDCIRISIFKNEIKNEDFRDHKKIGELKNRFFGFLILRPTEPNLLGRNIISPNAFKKSGFGCCTTSFKTTVNGLKFDIEGFPHSSQDTETLTCAETTIWAIMEYFSNRYPDYKPALPSNIIQTLSRVSTERQIPSEGLDIQQMSFALREFGFGTKIYSKSEYNDEFENLISCYIESGIPLIIAMENRPYGNIGHALICIGHEIINDNHYESLLKYTPSNDRLKMKLNQRNITIYDFDDIEKEFIFSDDNHKIYQSALLKNPAKHYQSHWHNCVITYFIAPLYPKIYLDAPEAKNFVLHFLSSGIEPLKNNSDILLRFYLASGRTFKDSLIKNTNFNETIKDLIIEKKMPKFIWIAELSTKELIKNKIANGLLILDATEPNTQFNKPLIIGAYQGNYIEFDEQNEVLINKNLTLSEFSIFEGNLKYF